MSNIHNVDEMMIRIREHFAFLFEKKFQVAKVLKNLAFGNWMIFLRSEECSIRITQDRGWISAEIAPSWISTDIGDNDNFIDLRLLVDFVEHGRLIVSTTTTPDDIDRQLDSLRALLLPNYGRIVALLNEENYEQTVEALRLHHEKRIKEHFPNARFRSR